MPDVVLVNMPYGILERPSLALGSLSGALHRAGIPTVCLYPHLDFARQMGLAAYRLVEMSDSLDLLGEWTFSPAAFGALEHDLASYQRSINFSPFEAAGMERETLWKVLGAMRERAPAFVDKVAREVVATGTRIVGASSTFQQHCASLALLRRIRELDPGIVTLMGGANCEGPMGEALQRNFPWVDLVFSGEADLAIVDLVHAIQSRKPSAEWPRSGRVSDLDQLPTPDFTAYFEALARTGMHRQVVPALPIETSRGCWWGARHHCTFCGLNGSGLGFRVKTPERALAEFDDLATRYRVKDFLVVDNILAMEAFSNLLPALAPKGYRMFLETKANLKRAHVEALAAAGAIWFLPGLESLHDEVLKLMDKGTTGLINLQTLKWSRELGLRVNWAILCGFPGEQDEWYAEMAEWLPALQHLQPPAWVNPVAYHRFSPYHMRPDDYGVAHQPGPAYPMVYPLPAEELRDLAYFFVDAPGSGRNNEEGPGLTRVRALVKSWHHRFAAGVRLHMRDTGEALEIVDTRSVARRADHRLTGEERLVYLACDTNQTGPGLQRQLGFEVQPHLDRLERDRLVLRQGARYLALATRGELPPLPRPGDFPGGTTGIRNQQLEQPWIQGRQEASPPRSTRKA